MSLDENSQEQSLRDYLVEKTGGVAKDYESRVQGLENLLSELHSAVNSLSQLRGSSVEVSDNFELTASGNPDIQGLVREYFEGRYDKINEDIFEMRFRNCDGFGYVVMTHGTERYLIKVVEYKL